MAEEPLYVHVNDPAPVLMNGTSSFTCPFCINLMIRPMVCPRGHSLCHRCCNMLGVCPDCDSDLSRASRNIGLQQIIDSFKFNCKNARRGCFAKDTHHFLPYHEAHCTDEMKECPLAERIGCTWQNLKFRAPWHCIEKHSSFLYRNAREYMKLTLPEPGTQVVEEVLLHYCFNHFFRCWYRVHPGENTIVWSFTVLDKNPHYDFDIVVLLEKNRDLTTVPRDDSDQETQEYISVFRTSFADAWDLFPNGELHFVIAISRTNQQPF